MKVVFLIALSALFSLIEKAGGANCKQTICHNRAGKGWETISVSCNALDAHENHGDLIDGPCEEQDCSDLCYHEVCMYDFLIDPVDGACTCISDPDPTTCGAGAHCDAASDECVCDDNTQVFNEDGDCVDPCVPYESMSLSIHMTFRDDFAHLFENDVDEDLLSELQSKYSDLFGLAGKTCWLTVKGLDTIAGNAGSKVTLPDVTVDLVVGDYVRCNVVRRSRDFKEYGPYLLETDCPEAANFFQSQTNKLGPYVFQNSDTLQLKSSDASYFEVTTHSRKFEEECDSDKWNVGDGWYDFLSLKWSVSASAAVAPSGSIPEPNPFWLGNGNFLQINHIPYAMPEHDSEGYIELPGSKTYTMVHNNEKCYSLAVAEYPDEVCMILPMLWTAKLYNYYRLPELKTWDETYGDAMFKILADVDEVVLDAGEVGTCPDARVLKNRDYLLRH